MREKGLMTSKEKKTKLKRMKRKLTEVPSGGGRVRRIVKVRGERPRGT